MVTVHCGLLFNVTDLINLTNLRWNDSWMCRYQGWIPWILRLKLKLVLKFRIILIVGIFTVNGTERPHCINALTSKFGEIQREITWMSLLFLAVWWRKWMIDLCYGGHFSKKTLHIAVLCRQPSFSKTMMFSSLNLQEATVVRFLFGKYFQELLILGGFFMGQGQPGVNFGSICSAGRLSCLWTGKHIVLR